MPLRSFKGLAMSDSFNRLWRRFTDARGRHPFDRGYFTEWEIEQIYYWRRHHAHRRHREPFAKSIKGHQRRAERKFIREQEHS